MSLGPLINWLAKFHEASFGFLDQKIELSEWPGPWLLVYGTVPNWGLRTTSSPVQFQLRKHRLEVARKAKRASKYSLSPLRALYSSCFSWRSGQPVWTAREWYRKQNSSHSAPSKRVTSVESKARIPSIWTNNLTSSHLGFNSTLKPSTVFEPLPWLSYSTKFSPWYQRNALYLPAKSDALSVAFFFPWFWSQVLRTE